MAAFVSSASSAAAVASVRLPSVTPVRRAEARSEAIAIANPAATRLGSPNQRLLFSPASNDLE